MKRFLLISLAIVMLLAGTAAAIRAWRLHVVARAEAQAYTAVQRLLREAKPTEALAVAEKLPRSDTRFPWSSLVLDALTAAHQVPRLVEQFERAPERILAREDASLLVARALMAARQGEALTRIREDWRGRETQPHLWLALDSDRLALEGHPGDAEALLRSRTFSGEAEATRLVRLSLYAAKRTLHEAWTLLDQAAALAPRDPEIRSFRAQILEQIRQPASARVEYVAAHVAAPANALLRDELAEFYRRQGSYDQALRTWRDAFSVPAPDFIWLKEAFWSRVIQPATVPPVAPHLSTSLAPLAQWVRELPPGRFWDEDSFQRLADISRYQRERAEVFWLRLVELLRAGQEEEAQEWLRGNPFRLRSWEPGLEIALARILRFRTSQTLGVPALSTHQHPSNQHQFFAELDRLAKPGPANQPAPAVSADLARLLCGRNAFAAAFLAAGWREAALVLADPTSDEPVPAWFVYGLAQCLRFNRGNADALAYLSRRAATPELSVLRAELLLAVHQTAEGLSELAALATHDSDAGYRAAWLLAQAQMESRQYAEARNTLLQQPRLAQSTTGREQLARLALLGGDEAEAETMYRAIETESVEARAFLARRAFAQKDWATARGHTEALLRLMPDELQLRGNLRAIDEAEYALAIQ